LQTNPSNSRWNPHLRHLDVDPKQEPQDNANLRRLAGQVQDILRAAPGVQVVQNDWFRKARIKLKKKIDPSGPIFRPHQSDVANSTTGRSRHRRHPAEGNQQIRSSSGFVRRNAHRFPDVENLYSLVRKIPPSSAASDSPFKVKWRRTHPPQEHFRTLESTLSATAFCPLNY